MNIKQKSVGLILAILFIDQWVKLYIKTHFYLGESISVFGFDWFQIYFVENNGMAFGFEFGGIIGKYILSIFRIVAVTLIGYYISNLTKKKDVNEGFILGISAIMAGALGNIIDSLFYGLIFGPSQNIPSGVAELFPEGGGYSTFLQGRVVDMLYFPIIREPFEFFKPVFNIADSAITIGVVFLILFQRKSLMKL